MRRRRAFSDLLDEGAVDEALSSLGTWEGLVEHLVVVVDVFIVLLEAVWLAGEEAVQLLKPRRIQVLTIWMSGMVGMRVLVLEILVGVGHVLRGVDFIELTVTIADFPFIGDDNILVLAEVGSHEWTIRLSVVPLHARIDSTSQGEKGSDSPAPSHCFELWHASDQLKCKDSGSTESQLLSSGVSSVKVVELSSVLGVHIV